MASSPPRSGDAKIVAWRIFGGGESPKIRVPSYELIDRTIQDYVASDKRAVVAATVRGWFAESGDYRWLKDEAKPDVATLVVEGIDAPYVKEAVWAVAAIEAQVMEQAIRARWTAVETASFLDALYETLTGVSRRDQILDASKAFGMGRQETQSALVSRDAIEKESPLWTVHHIERYEVELVIHGLYPAVGHLVDLAVALEGGMERRVVERLDHPVLQARAILRMNQSPSPRRADEWLDWIAPDSSDGAIAAAVFRVLRAAMTQSEEESRTESQGANESEEKTKRKGSRHQTDATGKSLVEGLVSRLRDLEPRASARWIGEVLSYSSQALVGSARSDKPDVLRELEEKCLEGVSELFVDPSSQGLLHEFQSGLQRRVHSTWTGYQARAAWLIRDGAGERASEIARDAVAHYAKQIETVDTSAAAAGDWFDWRDRDWFEALGRAIALSSAISDYEDWVSERCRRLPLSVWDVEENDQNFIRAEPLAQQWFLLAFLAIESSRELGRPVQPEAVRALAQALWRHARFASDHLGGEPEVSVAVELAARLAIELGEADDGWILEQAEADRAGPRALWALVDQRRIRNRGDADTGGNYDRTLETELTRQASRRFGSGEASALVTLQFWGRLWLALGAVEQAERTGIAILSFPNQVRDRDSAILVLRLLGLVARNRKLASELGERVAQLYNQLWSSFGSTAPIEENDRREIEEAFAGSGFLQP